MKRYFFTKIVLDRDFPAKHMIQTITSLLAAIAVICGMASIGMTFYLGKNKCKQIDRLVYGFEVPNDNLFAQILRLPNYGWAFASPWFAKRSHLQHIRGHFGKDFERPFIITHYLFMIGTFSVILGVTLSEFFSR